jgi:transcriptional regulator with XRE-family HTH domain
MRSSVNVSTPESVSPALARLNAAIDDVAQQPGWSYKRVATEAGIDVMTLHAVRKGNSMNPSDRTAWGLDRVLGYEKGKGVQRILAGKRPVPAEKPEEETDPAIAEIEATGLNREQKDILIAVYLNQRAAAASGVLEQAREWEEQRRRGA